MEMSSNGRGKNELKWKEKNLLLNGYQFVDYYLSNLALESDWILCNPDNFAHA